MNATTLIERRRGEIMGIAALMILGFHSHARIPLRLWRFIVEGRGNMGVDFFVFLSGFGIAYSLEKKPRFGEYYARRMRRLLPTYYCVMLCVWLIAGFPTLREAMQQIVPIGIWTGYFNCWYIPACLLYYLLIPLVFHMVRNARAPRGMALFWLFVLTVPVCIITRGSLATIAIGRFPALVMGTAMGAFAMLHHSRRDRAIDLGMLVAAYAAGLLLLRYPGLLSRATGDLILRDQTRRISLAFRAPLVVVALAGALELLERTPLRFVNLPLRFAGRYSLEVYLGHTVFFYFDQRFLHLASTNRRLLATLVVIWPLAWLLYRASRCLLALLDRLPIMKPQA